MLLFSHMQFRHPVAAQFGLRAVHQYPSRLEKELINGDHTELISRYYSLLWSDSSPRLDKIKLQWKSDVQNLEDEVLEEVVESQFTGVITAGYKLIQLKYLNRIYYSPHRLFKMGKTQYPDC